MADIELPRLTLDDSEVVAKLERLEKGYEQLRAEAEETQKVNAKNAQSFKDLGTSVESYEKEISGSITKTKDAAKEQASLNSEVTKSIKDYKVFGVSLNDVNAQYTKWTNALKSTVSSLKSNNDEFVKLNSGLKGIGVGARSANAATGILSKGFRILKVAIASTGIGLLVIALASLASFLTKTQEGSDKLRVVMAQVGSVVSVVVDRVSALGKAIFQLFEGDFEGAAQSARDAFTGIGDEIAKEFELSGLLERNAIAIEKEGAILSAVNEKRKADLKELNKIAEDITKTDAERLSAAQGAARLSEEALADEIRLGQQLIANKLGQLEVNEETLKTIRELQTGAIDANEAISRIGLNNSNLDDLKDLIGDINAVEAKRAEQLEVQTTLQNKINTIEDQRRAKIEAQRKEAERLQQVLQDQLQTLEDIATQSELDSLAGEERLALEKQLALEQAEILFQSVEDAATAAGREIDITQEKATILEQIEREYYRRLREIRDDNPIPDIANELEPIVFATEQTFDEAAKKAAEGVKKLADAVAPNEGDNFFEALDGIQLKILDAFGIDPETEEGKFLLDQYKSLFNSIGSIINAGVQNAINQQDALIEQSDERLAALNDQLDEARQDQEDGLANNVDVIEAEIERETQVREQAAARRAKIQENAAKRQILLDGLVQVSSITTAGAETFKANSKIPLVGIITAIAQIAAMVAAFKSLKATVPTLRKGLKLKGATHENGGIPIMMNGEQAYEAEDKEWLIGTRPSEEHDTFLGKLNDNQYSGIDLVAAMDSFKVHKSMGYRAPKSVPNAPSQGLTKNDVEEIFEKNTDKLLRGIEERPHFAAPGAKEVKRVGRFVYRRS